MTRADRGIERIEGADDLASTRCVDTLERPASAGSGGNVPKDLGIKVSKTLFAPRLGAVYRLNENTVFRAGYGITYNPLPFSRPLRGFYPLTLAASSTPTTRTAWPTTFEQGIPDVVAPDLSSGRHPAAELVRLMRTPDGRRVAQSHPVVERRRSSGRLPYDISIDMAYVGTAKNGGFADYRRQRVGRVRWRRRQPAVLRELGAATSRSCCGDRSPSRATTRCRWPSTGPSRTGSC